MEGGVVKMSDNGPKISDKKVEQALNSLITLLNQSEIIRDYKAIEAKVEGHEGLVALVEEIKAEQKNAVKFAHYGKPEAEKVALKEADRLTEEFDNHPLVIRYREKLIEANDLLQHLTKRFETKFNHHLEADMLDFIKNETIGTKE